MGPPDGRTTPYQRPAPLFCTSLLLSSLLHFLSFSDRAFARAYLLLRPRFQIYLILRAGAARHATLILFPDHRSVAEHSYAHPRARESQSSNPAWGNEATKPLILYLLVDPFTYASNLSSLPPKASTGWDHLALLPRSRIHRLRSADESKSIRRRRLRTAVDLTLIRCEPGFPSSCARTLSREQDKGRRDSPGPEHAAFRTVRHTRRKWKYLQYSYRTSTAIKAIVSTTWYVVKKVLGNGIIAVANKRREEKRREEKRKYTRPERRSVRLASIVTYTGSSIFSRSVRATNGGDDDVFGLGILKTILGKLSATLTLACLFQHNTSSLSHPTHNHGRKGKHSAFLTSHLRPNNPIQSNPIQSAPLSAPLPPPLPFFPSNHDLSGPLTLLHKSPLSNHSKPV
ncbi:hypothetical protein MBM_03684 [Drepanopeziza brunnea f. sp. 'multigermtubi' MB_m1]|uniref:Uncharacterized protein n=1 Tax=Marssonina brunnea f. sp. multigermtubi (strain MB_m1) TaxID=1072389 RepID=K1WZ55_MARBU|nr:uncharacterized protein MBM_03684 [Drepanopeziza brunnea f. sp. 'multigermtubi' MB_m1]EKD17912.1 hypothetical protein MBM_03684 [Drepanopeziza brunnea f. sp. 'multigermtubi' MB_m1]